MPGVRLVVDVRLDTLVPGVRLVVNVWLGMLVIEAWLDAMVAGVWCVAAPSEPDAFYYDWVQTETNLQ